MIGAVGLLLAVLAFVLLGWRSEVEELVKRFERLGERVVQQTRNLGTAIGGLREQVAGMRAASRARAGELVRLRGELTAAKARLRVVERGGTRKR